MSDEFDNAEKIATVPELIDRIRHDGKMLKRVMEQRDAARAEADQLRSEKVSLLIELNKLRREPFDILGDQRIGVGLTTKPGIG